MIKQECIGIPDMILLLMIFCFKKIKIKAEIVLSPGGAYFNKVFIFCLLQSILGCQSFRRMLQKMKTWSFFQGGCKPF